MKIIIKDENGQLAICSENEKPISQSRIWATLSLALASSIADHIQQKNLPPELKKALIEITGERVADAQLQDAASIFANEMKTVVIARYKMNLADRKEEFTGKEAAFLSKLFNL